MNPDFVLAGLAALIGLTFLYKPIRDPIVVAFWHPTSFPIVLVLAAGLIYFNLDLTALVLIVLYLYIHNNSHLKSSEDERVEHEVSIDDERFNPLSSVDIQFADGTAKHDPPIMIGWTKAPAPLLLFPPSQDTLRSMNG